MFLNDLKGRFHSLGYPDLPGALLLWARSIDGTAFTRFHVESGI